MFYTKYEEPDRNKSQKSNGGIPGLSNLFVTQYDQTEWE